MTKKHFIALAAAIKSKFHLDRLCWMDLNDERQRAALDAIAVIAVIEQVALDINPRFDSRLFRAACGVPA